MRSLEVKINGMEQRDCEIVEEEAKAINRNNFRTSIWTQSMEAAEKENDAKHQEQLQQQTNQRIQLDWLSNDLEGLEKGHDVFLGQQSRERRGRARELEAELRHALEAAAQRDTRRKKEEEQLAAEKIAREQEAQKCENDWGL